jgi:hypothetical protein
LPEEPAADADPATVCAIKMRGPGGENYSRRFAKATTKVSDLANWFKKESNDNSKVALLIPYPKKDLSGENLEKTLEDMKFAKQETVMVKYQ